ncbi:MAG: immunoglobulin domain-containing protein, partial [Candidatus Hydrogenedens sp.]
MFLYNYAKSVFVLSSLLLVLSAMAETVIPLPNIPQPASGSYFVTSAPLSDGTFLIWNGNQVYKQIAPKNDNYFLIAEGYQGDPAFVAISPDEKKAILGQGYLGDIYLLDLTNPQNFTPLSIIANISHYYGIYLTSDLLLLDVTKSDFSGSEIHILPLNEKNENISHFVLMKPKSLNKDMVIDKPPFAYSATLAKDDTWVYIMDGNAREIRKFSISSLVNAYNTHTTLDWNIDGIPVGTSGVYFTGGVSGISNDNLLIVAGSEGFMLPGGIQEINPSTGEIVRVWDPANNQGYYSAFYNPYSDTILAIVNNRGYLILRTEQEECPDCNSVRKSIYRSGEDVCLNIFGEIVPEGTQFTWSKINGDISTNPRISGIHCKKLLIYNAQPEDTGTYICSYGNEKAIYTVH